MILRVTVRDLVFVSWRVPAEDITSRLPDGLEPELSGDRALVTLAFARAVGGSLGPFRVPRFSKLTVHTYVTGPDGPGLYFLECRVSRSAIGRRLVGIPFHTARVRARRGAAWSSALRAAIRYEPHGACEPPELSSGAIGSHEVAYFDSGRVFRLVARHAPIQWERAAIEGEPQFGPVSELGFEISDPDSVLYSDRVSFRAELPPALVARR